MHYNESKKEDKKDKDNPPLNRAIGVTLERAIQEASKREGEGKAFEKDPITQIQGVRLNHAILASEEMIVLDWE